MKKALLALCLLAAPSAVLADTYTYAYTSGGGFESFTYTSPALLTTDTYVPAASLTSCAFFLGPCVGATLNAASHTAGLSVLVFGALPSSDIYAASAMDFTVGNHVENAFTLDITDNASVSATPEPSSLALLGTGILGAFGAARRRFARTA